MSVVSSSREGEDPPLTRRRSSCCRTHRCGGRPPFPPRRRRRFGRLRPRGRPHRRATPVPPEDDNAATARAQPPHRRSESPSICFLTSLGLPSACGVLRVPADVRPRPSKAELRFCHRARIFFAGRGFFDVPRRTGAGALVLRARRRGCGTRRTKSWSSGPAKELLMCRRTRLPQER